MSKLIRNSYLNPHGKGVLRTSNGKLAVFSSPVRLFFRYADGGEDIPYDLVFKYGGSVPVYMGSQRLNVPGFYYTTRHFSGDPVIGSYVPQPPNYWTLSNTYGPRVMDIWFFGKKITVEVTSPPAQKIADYTYDHRDGSVWVNDEYRGKWDR